MAIRENYNHDQTVITYEQTGRSTNTNEIGMGAVSENKVQRQFTDLQGWMNQYVASHAQEVILMVSGIAVKIK